MLIADRFPFKLLICDYDGTLVTTASGRKFPQGVSDRAWLPGRRELLLALKARGVRLAVATNQGGAAFGYFTPPQFEAMFQQFMAGVPLDAYAVCYEHPQGRVATLAMPTNRRKPAPGMLLELMNKLHLRDEDTLYVGDRDEDREAARAAQVNFMWADEFFDEETAFYG